MFAAGADALWVHARKAWLEGLSPKENRDIPPLDYGRVYRLKAEESRPVHRHQRRHPDAGRGRPRISAMSTASCSAAPPTIRPGMLADADAAIYGEAPREMDWAALIETMADYCCPPHRRRRPARAVTRHMVGLFHGLPGARRCRQILSTEATRPGAGPDVLRAAFAAVDLGIGQAAA